jgi:DNA polymerase II large subunit
MTQVLERIKANITNIDVPDLKKYYENILNYITDAYETAIKAREVLKDPESYPESIFVWDMADRIEKLVGPPGISKFIREFMHLSREELALKAIDKVIDDYTGTYTVKELAEKSLRLALAILTEGMTVAPIEGIQKVEVKRGAQGPYLSIYFAGPIRAAGGTEAGLCLVYADYIRRRLGLSRYVPRRRPNEDEVQRFIEELRLHEREVGRFQMRCSNHQIEFTLLNLPVEVTGPPTVDTEVLINRDLSRIETNRLRGGALRVINDGLVGRARKISLIIEKLGISGWGWLNDIPFLKEETGEESTISRDVILEEVIMGRPVISLEYHESSFRIRYGRGSNMGISAVGIHPTVFGLLKYFVVIGSQIKINYPGKGAILVPSSIAEAPIVKLSDGSVIQLSDPTCLKDVKDKIVKILWLGDIIISFGDVLENNRELKPSAYVPEWWLLELKERTSENISREILELARKALDGNKPTFKEAILLSKNLDIPLYPSYVFRWNRLNITELIEFLELLSDESTYIDNKLEINNKASYYLEKILIPFTVNENKIVIDYPYSQVLYYLVTNYKNLRPITSIDIDLPLKFISNIMGVQLKDVEGSKISARLGRPEKAMPRKLKPPVHVLFPIKDYGGPSRDIMKAMERYDKLRVDLCIRICPKCNLQTPYMFCQKCKIKTKQLRYCSNCRLINEGYICVSCGRKTFPYREYTLEIRKFMEPYINEVGRQPKKLKGVKGLMNKYKIPEYLGKGIIRYLHGVYIFKDGTCRVDITNAPLLKFRPKDIGVSVKKLNELGYECKSLDEWLDIKPQDIIIPYDAAKYLVRISSFIDDMLKRIYGFKKGYYNIAKPSELIGHLVIGLSPHTSAGIIGRIIGFTNAQVLYAHPLWHAAKRRDCDGDQDAIMLLLDVLINFSKHYLPSGSGGQMDAPLFINVVLLPEEVDTQPHNMDVVPYYPKILYEASLDYTASKNIKNTIKTIGDHLRTPLKYGPFDSTEDPPYLELDVNKSSYSRIKSMNKKVDEQLRILDLLYDDPVKIKIVEAILNKHILPDIIGNLRAFSTQSFRCKKCNKSYRRPPLRGVCEICGGDLLQSVRPKSIIKYLDIAKQLVNEVNVNDYLKHRIRLLEEEIMSTVTLKGIIKEKLTSYIHEKVKGKES